MARKNVKFVRRPGDKCYNCGIMGHRANTCVRAKKGSSSGGRSRNYYKRY